MKLKSLKERFESKCGPQDESGCIPWLGNSLPAGYGMIRRGRAKDGVLLAHRAAWILVHGEIPRGLFILHSCDNKRCVNVEHLRLGTQKENMADAWERGQCTGDQVRKIRDEQLPNVLAMHRFGMTHQAIADVMGVSRPLISNIVNGKMRSKAIANGQGDYHF